MPLRNCPYLKHLEVRPCFHATCRRDLPITWVCQVLHPPEHIPDAGSDGSLIDV